MPSEIYAYEYSEAYVKLFVNEYIQHRCLFELSFLLAGG